jgi:sn-glycerol 3-phosphate transport system ATP-binding protein
MAQLELRKVSKFFGPLQVVQDIDMSVADGEFVVLVGPSGCGKSTLLRMVAGLETVTSGEVAINGEIVNRKEPKDRDIAMVFQNYALYPHMTVYDNMAYGLKIRGMGRAAINEQVLRAARILELEPLLKRKPRELSGGQRQRVAMGRAIVREPAVFLFDEPLSNLDAKLRVQMRLEIQKLHRSLNTTSLYVTHDQVEAMTLAQRMLVMYQGRAEQIGEPMEVYARPASIFVAGFIGSPAMNFLAGTLEQAAGQFRLSDGTCVNLPAAMPEHLSGQSITLGVRPEHLECCAVPEASFSMNVEMTEMLGADTIAHGTVGSNLMAARLPHDIRPKPGEALPLRFSGKNLHFFDSGSGKRLV